MKILRTKYLPLGSNYSAINLLGVLFVHPGVMLTAELVNHERIHTRQMLELLVVPFYLLYVAEWLVRIAGCRNIFRAYRSISFEREAYDNEACLHYLEHRPHFAWAKYMKRQKKD